MRIIAYIPIKLSSERLPGKNIKSFENGEPLLKYIIKTALQTNVFDDIYIYCSSEEVVEHIPAGAKFLKRPHTLDLPSTSITEVTSMFTQTVEADIYALLNTTAPFLSSASIKIGIEAIKKATNDSALAVRRYNAFLWQGNKPINYDIYNIPCTQDLEPFFVETTGLYVFTKELARQRRRVGDTPYLIEVSDIESMDIDEPIDFEIANAVFNHIVRKGSLSDN
ncbi:MAG: acylneuraminate cytidylyltransferase [Prevotella sp.]|jgi:CMP-N-acetylneuraminic acid synthetase|nr:acylneuraminate cytidylyltransferase [Prevotella sp.]